MYNIDLIESDKYDPLVHSDGEKAVKKAVNIKALENEAVVALSEMSEEDEKEVLAELVALYGE